MDYECHFCGDRIGIVPVCAEVGVIFALIIRVVYYNSGSKRSSDFFLNLEYAESEKCYRSN